MDKSSHISMSEEARLRRDEVKALKLIANNLTVLTSFLVTNESIKAGADPDKVAEMARKIMPFKSVGNTKEE